MYNVTVTVFNSNSEYDIQNSIFLKTMEPFYEPQVIDFDHITIKDYEMNGAKDRLNAVIYWEPASGNYT